jgi:hypothetical protein
MGWLHRSTCYETRNIMRAKTNRLARETEAQRLGTTLPEAYAETEVIAAALDQALSELSETDRDAILARYFSDQSYAEIGSTLRLNENAARMRVDRALAKLRHRLMRRGVTSSAAMLAGALPTCASTKVPTGLHVSIVQTSILSVAGGPGIAVFLGFMSITKLAVGVMAVAAIGGLFYQYQRIAELETSLAFARAQSGASARKFESIQREVGNPRRQTMPPERPRTEAATQERIPESAPATRIGAPLAQTQPRVTPTPPQGWRQNGSANDLYEVGVDETNTWGNMPSAYAKSTGAADGKFGGMMQSISAEAYRGQRVRLNGWIKTEDANEGGGHLWMRVDGKERNQMHGFDNMDGRAPKGTTDWQDYSIVLDVPAEATNLNYGFFVSGKGKIWVNGVTITPVGTDVPVTDMRPEAKSAPVNLGFTPPRTN